MTPKTQSVCKHKRIELTDDELRWACTNCGFTVGTNIPVAEPASTGEPPHAHEIENDGNGSIYCIICGYWCVDGNWVAARPSGPASQTPEWKCFHCEFETSNYAEAEAHFGDGEGDPAICLYWSKLSTDERLQEFQDLVQQLNGERDEGGILLARAEKAENELAKLATPASTARTDVKDKICAEIQNIMRIYREQDASSYGVDTPGGLEHMGDVWKLLGEWDHKLVAINTPLPPELCQESHPDDFLFCNLPKGHDGKHQDSPYEWSQESPHTIEHMATQAGPQK